MDDSNHHDSDSQVLGLQSFQKLISDTFDDLSIVSSEKLLSIECIQKLLDAYFICQDEFVVILSNSKVHVSKPPLDRFVSDFLDRCVKALDICNASREGIEKIRLWEKHLEIVVSALDSSNHKRIVGEGQVRRARRELIDLALEMLVDEKDSSAGFIFSSQSHRNRSFGPQINNSSKDPHRHRPSTGHSRSLSWSVSRSWSAAKQLHSISNGLVPPRATEISATSGLALSVFSMNFVLMFVLWSLVAAIPCQDRGGLNIHLSIPRNNFPWAASLMLLQERIVEESRKQECRKSSSSGLLKEIHQMDKCVRYMTDLVDSIQFPLTEELRNKIREGSQELAVVCENLKNGLDPLERQVREMFHRIMSIRSVGLELLGKAYISDD